MLVILGLLAGAIPAVQDTDAGSLVAPFDTHLWDAKIRYTLNDNGTPTDYSQVDYDKRIQCDDSWTIDTWENQSAVNDDEWIRFGLDYDDTLVGYEVQLNGSLEYRVYDCTGDTSVTGFPSPDNLEESGPNLVSHPGWGKNSVTNGKITDEQHHHHDPNASSEPAAPDETPPDENHPVELSPNFGIAGEDDGEIRSDKYLTELRAHDLDFDPEQEGVSEIIEYSTTEATDGSIPVSGQVRATITNHDFERVACVKGDVMLGGRPWDDLDSSEHDCTAASWGLVECEEAGSDDFEPEDCEPWTEEVFILGWPAPQSELTRSTLPVGHWGSEVLQQHG